MTEDAPIRLGIIGAGHMTRKHHLPALMRLQKEGECIITEISDINRAAAEAAAHTYNIPLVSHDSARLIGREDVDAVCIFGPADVHYRLGIEVLRAGKHLFVEKPPAQYVTQLLEMATEAKVHGRIAAAGFNRRFQAPIQEVKGRLAQDAIQSAKAVFDKPQAELSVPFGMKTLLGVNSIHAIDTLLFVMGDRPTALYAAHGGGVQAEPKNFSALIEWDARHATLSANNSAGSRTEAYTFHGHGVSYSCEGDTLSVSRDTGETESFTSMDESKGVYHEFKAFFDSIRTGESPVNSLECIVPTLYLVELIERGHRGTIDWSVIGKVEKPTQMLEERPASAYKKTTGKSVLILNPTVFKRELPDLAKKFTILYEQDLPKLSPEERSHVSVVLAGGGGTALETRHIELLPNLAVLGVAGASVKKWGASAALEKGIAVINTADVLADAVAEFIVMQALVGVRHASVSHEALRRGGWGFATETKLTNLIRRTRRKLFGTKFSATASSRTLAGRTVGLIGWGEITKKTIPLFVALGAEVSVHSSYLTEGEAAALGVRKGTMGEVLRCDVVSLQRGLSARTERAFGAREINSLKTHAVFINSARASLVDSEALLTRLEKRDIFACLDVFDEEPLPRNHPLRRLPNVFLTSHIAGSIKHTAGLQEAANKKLIEKVADYLDGKPVETITQEQFENMT